MAAEGDAELADFAGAAAAGMQLQGAKARDRMSGSPKHAVRNEWMLTNRAASSVG
jgi:hypothetical protein